MVNLIYVSLFSLKIEVCPGDSISADFQVTNFGPKTSLEIEVTDTINFLASEPDFR